MGVPTIKEVANLDFIVSLLIYPEEKLGKQPFEENAAVPTDENLGVLQNTVVCVVHILLKVELLVKF